MEGTGLPGCVKGSDEDGAGGRTAAVREAAENAPMPLERATFDVQEADLWRRWRIPVGSVLVYHGSGVVEGVSGIVAVMVVKQMPDPYGI